MAIIPFHEAVRKRPGMYIGRLGSVGVGYMISELVRDFAVDLGVTEANIHINQQGEITVRFSPVQCSVAEFVTLLKNGKKSLSSPLWTISLAIISPLSKRTNLKIGDETFKCNSKGRVTPAIKSGKNKIVSRFQISFLPDEKILKAKLPDNMILWARLQELTFVCSKLKIIYRDESTQPFTQIVWHSPKGIRHLLDASANKLIGRDFETGFSFDVKNIRGEVCWFYANSYGQPPQIYAFANGELNSHGGSHVSGVARGILKGVKGIVKENASQYELTIARAVNNLCFAVSIWCNEISYKGNTRSCVDHKPLEKLLVTLVSAHIQKYYAENKENGKGLIERFRKQWPFHILKEQIESGELKS